MWLSGAAVAQTPPAVRGPDYFAPATSTASLQPARTAALAQAPSGAESSSPSDLPPVVSKADYECEPGGEGSLGQRFVANQRDCWWGYPTYFQEPPLGARVYGCFAAQVTRGNATRFTLYHYDFNRRTGGLTDRGRRQVAKFAAELETCPYGILIQPVPHEPQLDAARRAAVVAELESLGTRLDPSRVVVGHPRAAGLAGMEASQIQSNLDRQTQRGTGGPSMNESFRSSGFSPSSNAGAGTSMSR